MYLVQGLQKFEQKEVNPSIQFPSDHNFLSPSTCPLLQRKNSRETWSYVTCLVKLGFTRLMCFRNRNWNFYEFKVFLCCHVVLFWVSQIRCEGMHSEILPCNSIIGNLPPNPHPTTTPMRCVLYERSLVGLKILVTAFLITVKVYISDTEAFSTTMYIFDC